MKNCTGCGERKPLSEFSLKNGHPRSRCKPCVVIQSRASIERRKKRDPEGYRTAVREDSRGRRRDKVVAKYGLTSTQVNSILIDQKGLCAICGCSIVERPHVDHDHKTGKVRGLLCLSCNVGLGHFGDSVAKLRDAIEYLERGR